ncbi:competence type IV pilus minor pilin ComGF [Staphylococcus marylandisciuri]|uniref:competence type IV pilus minor pilin ComGF n=1 Tax=Staphylococcus marylandisciuri TaxID=2981529 RepID=UPI0021D3C23C|nr:competence type IV pilus minor pilin ComGF [Staphylococcus marylandisciuri]
MLTLPLLIKSTSFFDSQLLNNTDIDLEFFARDLIDDFSNARNTVISQKNQVTTIKSPSSKVSYTFNHHKIIKQIDDRGNITVLNHVSYFEAHKINKLLIEIRIKIQDKQYDKEKIFYI